MNIPPIQMPATHLLQEPVRPSLQAPQEITRPVAAANQADAATQEARRQAERREEREGRESREDHSEKQERDLSGRPRQGPEEQRELERLRARESEVQAHEAAHQAAGHHASDQQSQETTAVPEPAPVGRILDVFV